MGKVSTSFAGYKVMFRLIMLMIFPKIAKFFKIQFFGAGQASFYHNLVHETMMHRKKHGIIRQDMIHLLMEAQKGTLKSENVIEDDKSDGFATAEEVSSEDLKGSQKEVWHDDELTAQCFLFFLAGFETSSTLLCLASSELMENPDIQQTLIDKCDCVKQQLNGKPLTYEVLQNMKYMDMVISGRNMSNILDLKCI